ncbi:hypothetical protein ACFQMA_06860 [Halosimplex aquaticum]|uniref:DUF7115 domain-containing protein n=1 Tax=Halosimplex aquaticum TaxID=3026162 RepID=A0ABD5Y152_9EURY|nr:hypothetical protein [Halosimplex aquaticum]
MDIPDLVKGALGDEEIQAGVSLGDEDAVCLTPTRTLVYRGEGLLSDEQVEEYSHDIEQLAVSEGRRKTKFTMQYIDGTESFTVPANRGDKVLALFLEGVLRLDGVIEARESVAGVYRFSELTLIITEGRLIKHIGNQVWTEDFEVYPYEDVTGLEFERASVATSIALSVDGRPQRVKVPNDKAPVVRQTLEEALFGYYDVGSIDELNRVVGADDATDAGDVETADADDGGFAFGDDFDPLVSDEDDNLTDPVDPAGGPEGEAFSEQPADAGQSAGTGGPTEQQTEPVANQPADPSTEQQTGPASGRPGAGAESPAKASGAGNRQEGATGQAGRSGSEEQSQPSERGQQQPSEPAPSEPQSSGASASEAAASTQSGRQGGETSPEQPRQTAQNTTPEATGAQGNADRSSVESAESATEPTEAAGGHDQSPDPETGGRSASMSSPADQTADSGPVSRDEYEALAERVEELTDAVDRQNELLKRQHRALKQLVQQNQQSE